jgi:phospholipase C
MPGIEHVIVVMMENRSFDEYFGTFPGVAGFYDDWSSIAQPWPDPNWPAQVLYPFRMSTFTTNALAAPGLGHDWATNHVAINSDPGTGIPDNRGFYKSSGANADVMGCYVADDIPYHWALAQNFALCDHYFCSALAGTFPNRMYLASGTITDPDQAPPASGIYPGNETNWNGDEGEETHYDGTDPVIYNFAPAPQTPGTDVPTLPWATNLAQWTSYLADLWNSSGGHPPSYRIYDDWNWQFDWSSPPPPATNAAGFYPGVSDLNVFPSYEPYQGPSGPITLGTPDDPNYFAANVNSNGSPGDQRPLFAQHINPMTLEPAEPFLAQLTWILPPYSYSEHPSYKSSDGALYLAQIVDALMQSQSDFWDSTVLVITYDESDTHFDHLPPPLSPDPRTQPRPQPYEPWVQDDSAGSGFSSPAPIGAGMRVPTIIVSPWTYQQGIVSDQMDHTSILRLMETVSGVTCTGLPPAGSSLGWRRANFANLYQVIDPENAPATGALQITGVPTATTVRQWQANANNRYTTLAQPANNPVPFASLAGPPVPQACTINNNLSFSYDQVITELNNERTGQAPQPGPPGSATMANALTVNIIGFEPDEFVNTNAGVPPWVPQSERTPVAPQVAVQNGGTCDTRVPAVTVVSGANPGEFTFTCTQVSTDPNLMVPEPEPGFWVPITFGVSVTFNSPITTFAFRRGIVRTIDLVVSFTVDTTVTVPAQMELSGGTLVLKPLGDACAYLAEQITLAEQQIVAFNREPQGPGSAQELDALERSLGALQAQYAKQCGSGGTGGPTGPIPPIGG